MGTHHIGNAFDVNSQTRLVHLNVKLHLWGSVCTWHNCTIYHIEVRQWSSSSPENRSSFKWFDPQEISEHQGKYSNSFIIIATSYRTRDIAWNYSNKSSSKKTSSWIPDFSREEEHSNRCETTNWDIKKSGMIHALNIQCTESTK